MIKGLLTILFFLNTFLSIPAQINKEIQEPERVFLHTDRNSYTAGDNLFYTLYLHGNPGHCSKYAYLILRDQNNSLITGIRLEINSQTAYGSVFLPDTLNTGVYQIVCYTNSMRNENEANFFRKEIVIANRFDEKLTQFPDQVKSGPTEKDNSKDSGSLPVKENLIIHLDKQEFIQREKIAFSVMLKSVTQDSISRFSVSISEIIPGFPVEPTISDFLSDNGKAPATGENDLYSYRFIPEISGAVLQGKVLPAVLSGKETDSIVNNGSSATKKYTVLVSTIDSISNLQYTTTDSFGSFSLFLNPYYDGKSLIIRLKEKANAIIEPDNKFLLKQSFIPSEKYNVPRIREYLVRSIKISQVKKFYDQKEATLLMKEFFPSKTIPRVYYKHYPFIYPSDFLELSDFPDISREIIPAFKIWKVKGRFVSGYVNLKVPENINIEPEIFLDGVPIDDINQIITLGSKDIKSIQSLNVTRYFGEMAFNGILSLFSKNLVINNVQFKTPAIKYQALASQPYTKPESIKTKNTNDHNPDLRQLLLWEPEIIMKDKNTMQFECYTSDLTGKYLINIQGITSNGSPLSGSVVITIKSKTK